MAGENDNWIVVRTKPGRQKWAADNVARQHFDLYFPLIGEVKILKSKSGMQRVLSSKPLFPDYLFVKDQGRWRALLSTFGVLHVLLSGDRPAVMPAREIDRLRATENESGLVVLPSIAPAASRFKAGQLVLVNGGAMAGVRGVYQGQAAKDRVRVLLDVLGRKTTVLLAEELLEPV